MTWGMQDKVIERFTAAGVKETDISFKNATYTFEFDGPPDAFVRVSRQFYGPTMNAFEAVEKMGRSEDLHQELEAIFARQNASGHDQRTVIPATFLLVQVRVS
jgi:hypothetical protein